MGTRGSAYFEVADSTGHDVVGKLGIRWDAYPEGFGAEMCKKLAGAYVGMPSQESVDAKSFENIERVILDLIDSPSEYLDDEYVYRFIFTPPKDAESYLVADVTTVEVKYHGKTFTGSFKDFEKFCEWDE